MLPDQVSNPGPLTYDRCPTDAAGLEYWRGGGKRREWVKRGREGANF